MMAKTTLAHFFSKPFLIVSNMIFMTFLRQKVLKKLAEWTGLEPATPGVTGRYSNQLNYRSMRIVAKILVGGEGLEPPTLAL
jgi:hypothetical protein